MDAFTTSLLQDLARDMSPEEIAELQRILLEQQRRTARAAPDVVTRPKTP